jgi:hypothetical protein
MEKAIKNKRFLNDGGWWLCPQFWDSLGLWEWRSQFSAGEWQFGRERHRPHGPQRVCLCGLPGAGDCIRAPAQDSLSLADTLEH